MSQKDKLFIKFKRKPSSCKFREVLTLLEYYGFVKIPAKGSHMKFSHHKLPNDLVIPVHNHECKEFYKELALTFIEKVK